MAPITLTERGIYCEAGDFYIDPWRPVERAVITHAHSDHARWGMGRYLCATEGERVLRERLAPDARVDVLPYGQTATVGGAKLSLHPAGHILGSAQVRVEVAGQVAVVTGDYKTEADATCSPYEPVRCHLFVTESTFGLPVYRWRPQSEVFAEINAWWASNREAGRTSMLFGYALGKAQRLLSGLDPAIGPILLHGALLGLTQAYRDSGVALPQTLAVADQPKGFPWAGSMVLAPPSANATPWMRRFGDVSTAFASGWMAIRGARRRRAVDRGFVLSDHVDWPSLLAAIDASGAEQVWVTHGYSEVVARFLRERGMDARVLSTEFIGEPSQDEDVGNPSDSAV